MAKTAPFTLDDLTGGPISVLNGMLEHPEIKGKRVNATAAMIVARKVAQKQAVQMGIAYVQSALTDMLWNHVAENGPRPEGPEGDDWDAIVDDKLETIFDPYSGALTADWLARHTIGSRIDEENAISMLSIEFGKEVFRVLLHNAGTYDKDSETHTPVDILEAIGLTRTDVQAALDERTLPSEQEELANMTTTIFHVANRIKAAVGVPKNLRDELDLASDSDDILSQAAAQRLGCWLTDIGHLRAFRTTYGPQVALDSLVGYVAGAPYTLEPEDTPANSIPAPAAPDVMPSAPAAPASIEADPYATFGSIDAIVHAMTPAPVVATSPLSQPVTADTPAPARRSRKAATEAVTVGAGELAPAMTQWVLSQIKQHSSLKDDALAGVLGLSRGTLNNIVNGKNQRKLDPGERQKLADLVEEHLNALQQVSDHLRGVAQ